MKGAILRKIDGVVLTTPAVDTFIFPHDYYSGKQGRYREYNVNLFHVPHPCFKETENHVPETEFDVFETTEKVLASRAIEFLGGQERVITTPSRIALAIKAQADGRESDKPQLTEESPLLMGWHPNYFFVKIGDLIFDVSVSWDLSYCHWDIYSARKGRENAEISTGSRVFIPRSKS